MKAARCPIVFIGIIVWLVTVVCAISGTDLGQYLSPPRENDLIYSVGLPAGLKALLRYWQSGPASNGPQ